MTNIEEQTLASIVTQQHQAVSVLEKYSLDFCCKGKRTLSEACMDKGIPVETVSKEISESTGQAGKKTMPLAEMNAEQLISHILVHHHFYVKQSMPQISNHLEKIAAKHGERYPNMVKVLQLFTAIREEMTLHMQKEEQILFPRIREVERLSVANLPSPFAAGYIQGPVNVMEAEHDHAGELLYEIRRLTNEYTAPEDACTTFKVCLTELKEFEEDLHQHVHAENNHLFPLAEKMMEGIAA